jgi:hypothetical protein
LKPQLRLREEALMFLNRLWEGSRKQLAALAANPIVFPGARKSDRGKVRMGLELTFECVEDAKAFLEENHLPTVIFERR